MQAVRSEKLHLELLLRAQNRRYVEVFPLPRYWPELNATERIWNYTRKHATHNRYFETPDRLCHALFQTNRL